MTQILHIVRNPVTHDSRVLKEAGVILERFPERNLVIAGFHDQGYAEQELIGNRQVHRWRLKTRPLPKDLFSQAIKFFEWRCQLIEGVRTTLMIHGHALSLLQIAVKLKIRTFETQSVVWFLMSVLEDRNMLYCMPKLRVEYEKNSSIISY